MNIARRFAVAGFVLPLLFAFGCGMPGVPQPPSLKLPEPVVDLAATRAGNEVLLHWTMPKRTTDKVLLKGDQKAEICRQLASESCVHAGSILVAPQASASFIDPLPAALTAGPSRPLTYTVLLDNHAGRNAGPSNQAVIAAGAAPPQVETLQARAVVEGVMLTWTPQSWNGTIRIHRELVQPPAAQKSAKKSDLPPEQTLEISGQDHGQALDPDAALDHVYRYTVQRIAQVQVQGHALEIASAQSQVVTINARDIFPPAPPRGLEAVGDPEARAIDLSWQPDSESDLAGYAVYRREKGAAAQPEKISPPTLAAPSFRDVNAHPGHTYEYAVSAIDHDGNESQRSAWVEETLPQP